MREVKNIPIEIGTHDALKKYCEANGLIMKFWVKKIIKDWLKEEAK